MSDGKPVGRTKHRSSGTESRVGIHQGCSSTRVEDLWVEMNNLSLLPSEFMLHIRTVRGSPEHQRDSSVDIVDFMSCVNDQY